MSNLIKTAAKRYLEETGYVDESEMDGILADTELVQDLKEALEEADTGMGKPFIGMKKIRRTMI